MSKYPNELDKKCLKWLRNYGYTLNADDEVYKKLKDILKDHYPFQYYMWVDLGIKKEAESLVPISEKYWGRKFISVKRKIIKEKYKLIK